jgi:protoporphyrinogen oxidase
MFRGANLRENTDTTSPTANDLRVRMDRDLPMKQITNGTRPASAAPDLRRGDEIETAVLGAGPAGLTAAYVLSLKDRAGAVFEMGDMVGGIAKTVEVDGYRFDIGGHRFFTKLKPIGRLWEEMLGDDFLTRARLSRIYYRGQFFPYPLRAPSVIGRLGLRESLLCALSYLWSRVRGYRKEPRTFEEWVTNHFGKRLYRAFFRDYTEKVWGVPGSEIRSEWAAQRIKNFSLWKALLAILRLRRQHVTTMIEEFRYPRLGPGQMWEAFRERVEDRGVPIHLNHRCELIRHREGRAESIVVSSNGELTEHAVDGVVSTMPVSELVLNLEPPPPDHVIEAARRLRYRDFCLVALMTTQGEPFPDNWIYLQDKGTRAGRVQNFGVWSESMVPPGMTCLGVEYFCFEGDEIWEMPEDEAVELAKGELGEIGLIDPARVTRGVKVRVPKAYPMYDSGYEEALPVVRAYMDGLENIVTCGRNGLHRYNNQDHSMWTAILATVNLLDGAGYDVWSVNSEAEYLEEGEAVDELLDVRLTS